MGRQSGFKCCVKGCDTNYREKQFSLFCIPVDRCEQWLEKIGRQDLAEKGPERIKKTYRVCGKHFENKFFLNDLRNRLQPTAIPTINIRQALDNMNIDIVQPPSAEEQRTEELEESVNTFEADEQLAENSLQVLNTSTDVGVQTEKHLSSHTPRKDKLRKKINALRRLQLAPKKGAMEENEELEMLKHLSKKYLNLPLSTMVNMEVDYIQTKKRGQYSNDYKQFALTAHFYGPRTYRYLRSFISLPSIRTLQRFTQSWTVKCGYDQFALNAIQMKMEHLTAEEKNCTLIIDEMSIKRNYFYNIKTDTIVGTEDLGIGCKKFEPAAFALGFMLRGMHANWKQPLGYALLNSNCSAEDLVDIISRYIIGLRNFGCNVRVVVSDLGSNFLKFSKMLGITASKPYFEIDGSKIYYYFDPCHLIKATRNNFFNHSLVNKDMEIKKTHLQEFFQMEKESNLKYAPKLTEHHMNPTNFERMKVRYATQVFSNSVAAGMKIYVSNEVLSREAIPTIQFIEDMNKLFDILNSHRTFGDAHDVVFLMKMVGFFQTLKVIGKNGKNMTNHIKCFQCWIVTLNAVLQLKEESDIITRKLNSDPIENFFGSIRQQCGNANNPTPIQFVRAFKKLFLMEYFQHTESANCVDDLTASLNSLLKSTNRKLPPIQFDNPGINSLCVSTTDYRDLDLPEQNKYVYLSGYLYKKCLSRHKCDVCLSCCSKELNPTNEFTHLKSFKRDEDSFGSLIVPNEAFVKFVHKMDETFFENFEDAAAASIGVGHYVKTKFMELEFSHPCEDFPIDYLLSLFVRFRMYNTLKNINKEFIKNVKNKKLNIVSHM